MASGSFLSSLVAAVLGGGVTAAALIGFGAVDGAKTTTLVQPAALSPKQAAVQAGSTRPASSGLTPREIYKRDAPGVVFIRAQVVRRAASVFDPFGLEQQGESTGSGFVVDREGYILTNAHVVSDATSVTVQFGDQEKVPARIIGKDESTDLALLKVEPKGLELTPLELGDSKAVQVGDPTIAIGNPFGYDRTLTTGVVSALQRRITAPNEATIEDVIQTDAAINPGNSGGPLLDATGRVIGINSQIATGSSGSNGSVGIGFAVPVDTAKRVLPELREFGRVRRPWLGVDGRDVDASAGLPKGVLVVGVAPDSPAERAGVRGGDVRTAPDGGQVLVGGDVIVTVDGRPTASVADIQSALSAHKPGDSVEVVVQRGDEQQTLTVELGDKPPLDPTD